MLDSVGHHPSKRNLLIKILHSDFFVVTGQCCALTQLLQDMQNFGKCIYKDLLQTKYGVCVCVCHMGKMAETTIYRSCARIVSSETIILEPADRCPVYQLAQRMIV